MRGDRAADCLFVYGTLMATTGHPMGLRLAAESAIVGPGTVPGRLFDLGSYPGAILSGGAGGRVHGMVVRLIHPARSLPWLDAYEGAGEEDPEPRAYMRVLTAVQLTSGRRIDAWVYDYRGPLDGARRHWSGRYSMAKSLASLPS